MQNYRELVPLIEKGPLNLWAKLWHFWGRTKGYFEGVGEFFWNLNFPANKKLLTETVPANKSLLTGTVPINNSILFICDNSEDAQKALIHPFAVQMLVGKTEKYCLAQVFAELNDSKHFKGFRVDLKNKCFISIFFGGGDFQYFVLL